jgi:hypothetical protein
MPALRPDPSDWLKPRNMDETVVLYRSMSIAELADICSTGLIQGGGNRFNWFDARPYVFFGDELNDQLISQGEDLWRQARHTMSNHPLTKKREMLQSHAQRQARLIIREMDADGIRYARTYVEDFLAGYDYDVKKFKRAVLRSLGAGHRKYGVLFQALATLHAQQDQLNERLDETFELELKALETCTAAATYSSAVIVTRPVTGGLIYSTEFGGCGLGEREYCFLPGQLKFCDISDVILVKCGVVVEREYPKVVLQRLGSFAELGAPTEIGADKRDDSCPQPEPVRSAGGLQ